jgi:hypothetical protein
MLIWAEGFDHYGDGSTGNEGRDYMLSGAWSSFSWANGVAPRVDNVQVRSGTQSLRIEYNSLATDSVVCRRVLGTAHIVVGCGLGVYFDALPIANKGHGFEFRNNLNQCIAYFSIESDGAIGVYTGSARTLIASSDPIITASSWQHIEAKIVCDTVVGEIEVRVNGFPVLQLTDLNLGSLGATQMAFGMPAGEFGSSLNWQMDDIVTWNDDGLWNNDFLGPVRVEPLYPDADTAETDWVRNAGASDFAAINNNPPDADTTYLMAANLNDRSEFGMQDSPPETANIKAIFIPTMGKLISAGTGEVTTSLISGADVSDGPNQTFTTSYTYWPSVHEVDPATDLPWTKTAVDAMLLRIEKVL